VKKISQDIDLKKLEKKAITSTFQDGFFDIFLGIIIFGIGITSFTSLGLHIVWFYTLFSMLFTIPVLIFFSGKKYITTPRLGIVKFKPKRKTEKIKITLILVIFIIITLIFAVLEIINLLQYEEYVLPFVFGLFFAIPISLFAYFLKLKRLYVFAVLGGICFFISEYSYSIIGNPIIGFLGFIILGIAIICCGMVLLIQFLRKYPLPKEEMT